MSEKVMLPVQQTWIDFLADHNVAERADGERVAEMFAPEMRRYCEFIQGPGGTPVGFMVRGERLDFTLRAQRLMAAWQMPSAGIAHHAALAAMFEHKRAFLKLEWHKSETVGQRERLIAFYFRRRPAVKDMLGYLQQHGVRLDILERVADVARLLDKNSIHFVAAALRPDHQARHKLYFSQYVTPERFDDVTRRLQTVLTLFDIHPDVQSNWSRHHTALLSPDEISTMFVSVSFERDAFIPSVKLDYPKVEPQVCLELLPPKERARAEIEIRALCDSVGLDRLSYLGVRLHRSDPLELKYYADF